MKTRYKYINFEEYAHGWDIWNNARGNRLGRLRWNDTWKMWVLSDEPDAIWSMDCLADVQAFVKRLPLGQP